MCAVNVLIPPVCLYKVLKIKGGRILGLSVKNWKLYMEYKAGSLQ